MATSPRRELAPSSLWEDDEPRRPAAQPLRASWEPLPDEPPAPRDRPARPVRHRSWFGWFVHRYGWRVYAIPVLTALTVLAVLQIARVPQPGPTADTGTAGQAPVTLTVPTTVGGVPTVVTQVQTVATTVTATSAPSSAGSSAMADPNSNWAKNFTTGALPPGNDFVDRGKGTWHVVKGTTKQIGSGAKVYTYTIEVENGIESATDDAEFALRVDSVLSDPRSWIAGGDVALRRVDSGTPDFRISLTSPKTLRNPDYCGYDIPLEASCYNGFVGRVFINDARWQRGALTYDGDLGLYRVYAINHEVGHALGHGHEPCAVNDGLAPVMMQQSFSTSNDDLAHLDPNIPSDGKVCRVNPYPYPMAGATAAASTRGSTPSTTAGG